MAAAANFEATARVVARLEKLSTEEDSGEMREQGGGEEDGSEGEVGGETLAEVSPYQGARCRRHCHSLRKGL